ncbi:DUF4367 domain-containing protein [Thermaerobacter sp. PB12/4term]|uniref:DUF4367 domain-containing protein n=1 Tax=Thermaerobacter sp. PB12/4term TaxID=2293838 RepID=UPI00352D1E4D
MEGVILVSVQHAEAQQVELRYVASGGHFVIRERWLNGQTAFGSLYDTDDARVHRVSVGRSPGTLIVHKAGYVQLTWAIRGYALTVEGTIEPQDALRVPESLGPSAAPGR